MMSRGARVPLLVTAAAALLAACATADTATADPEAQRLDPPVIIVDEPEPEPEPLTEAEQQVAPQAVAKDPNTEVITFVGADAEASMTDEITAAPKRDPLPSMMSDIINGPNK